MIAWPLFIPHSLNQPMTLLSEAWVEHLPELTLLIFIALGLARHQMQNKRLKNRLKERSERKKIPVPMIINTPITQEFSIKAYDISMSGAFLSSEDLKHSMAFTSLVGKRTGIRVGDKIDIRIYLGRFRQIECQARVVRYNLEVNERPPHGIGIEFIGMSRKHQKMLAELIASGESTTLSA